MNPVKLVVGMGVVMAFAGIALKRKKRGVRNARV